MGMKIVLIYIYSI